MLLKFLNYSRFLVDRTLHDSLGLSRPAKRLIVMLVDSAVAFIAVWLAYYLRLGEWRYLSGNQWFSVVASLAVVPIFWIFGLYRVLFRHIGLGSLVGISRACFLYALIYATIFLFLGVSGVPRTIGLIQPLLLFFMIGANRIALRLVLGRVGSSDGRPRVLIYGAGASGRQLASAISGSGEMDFLGFIDDNIKLQKMMLNGKHIYSANKIEEILKKKEVTDILLALPSVSRSRRNEIIELLRPLGVNVRTIPGLLDLANGRVEVSSLRNLDIEDLLGRDPVKPDPLLFPKNIFDKVVLVTGAGGSIGSELCRQIMIANPKKIILLEINEYALYSIESELRNCKNADSQTEIFAVLASVRDKKRVADVLKAWKPDTVYHAAAYKHVPMVEKNVTEGVWNNAFGTYWTAIAAQKAGVKDFVLVSTDKAVRPTNVMGATKRIAELSLQALASTGGVTRFSMVRFGNVLGSSGSVVPLFRSQIAKGGPVTITHSEVTRYFMTIPEAAQLVIQAAAMAEGGEVFVLDMGEPVLIADLARKMIELSGATVRDHNNFDGEISIIVVGLRPGEKLYEELLIGDDPLPTTHPLIMKSRENYLSSVEFSNFMSELEMVLSGDDVDAVYATLRKVVPEFLSATSMVDVVQVQLN